jgi:hypothetical protein
MNTMLPPARPRLTREAALKALSAAGVTVAPGELIVGAIRGYYQDNHADNRRGIYDDCIFILGPEHFSTYNGNTDPSVTRPGVASLALGVHEYRPGNHGISRPGGGYPAFRPATRGEVLPVTRDGETNPRPGVAMNIHRGLRNSTSSLGCQTVFPDQWEAFRASVMDQLRRTGQKKFRYALMQ